MTDSKELVERTLCSQLRYAASQNDGLMSKIWATKLIEAADLIERQKAAIEIAKKHLNSAGMHEMLFALTNKENTDD